MLLRIPMTTRKNFSDSMRCQKGSSALAYTISVWSFVPSFYVLNRSLSKAGPIMKTAFPITYCVVFKVHDENHVIAGICIVVFENN